jgi:hypothetical protein
VIADEADRLQPLDLVPEPVPPEGRAGALVADAERRVERFLESESIERIPGFVVGNAWLAWDALTRIREEGLAPGPRFCEWGSGFGIVTGLAALAGFDACGIEIEPELVEHSRALLADHGIPAEFHRGSYVPDGARTDEIDEGALDRDLGFGAADFDVVYAYPWPVEEDLVACLFAAHAPPGALLLTFHGRRDLRVRRRE